MCKDWVSSLRGGINIVFLKGRVVVGLGQIVIYVSGFGVSFKVFAF
jgi:hypothetical protein